MAYILNIETSTTNCSVSLSHNGETLALKEDYNTNYSHAERLHIYIDEVLAESKVSKANLNAIAVSKGPGSYTGLRIGVSAAKGLCFALDIPLISVDTLKSLASQIKIKAGLIIPMLDARRMEVYSAIFDSSFKSLRETKAEILNENSFIEELNQGMVHFIGNGVEKSKSIINHTNTIFVEGKLPSANEMSSLAYAKYQNKDFENVAYFEPYYLKNFIAIKPKS